MGSVDFIKIPTIKTAGGFRQALEGLSIDLPIDDEIVPAPDSPLAQSIEIGGRSIGNRFCVQPMEGWDGTIDGRPSALTERRWRRFGQSGAKLIWGGEAVAVRHDGRANPHQLMLNSETVADIARLRETLVEEHRAAHGSTEDLMIGLQLTHSGRFCRPDRWDKAEPIIAHRHPILDRRQGLPPEYPALSDGDIRGLVDDYAVAARLARDAGFDFVDIKHCHGYLGHELLGAHTRPGEYGGSLANRTRFLSEIVEAIRSGAPDLSIGVRVSAFDIVPFEPDPYQAAPGKLGPGIPSNFCDCVPYLWGFGVSQDQPTEMDLSEPLEFMSILRTLGIMMVNLTAGSPYYSHHIQRPALYPPSDGYQPPEDPLVGVARLLFVARLIKSQNPDMTFVGTGFTYLQEFLPHVAQAMIRDGWVDFVGLGRSMLSYPTIASDVLNGRGLSRKRLCRTFSDCTTAPRAGLASGCYPLDDHYGKGPLAPSLVEAKDALKRRLQSV